MQITLAVWHGSAVESVSVHDISVRNPACLSMSARGRPTLLSRDADERRGEGVNGVAHFRSVDIPGKRSVSPVVQTPERDRLPLSAYRPSRVCTFVLFLGRRPFLAGIHRRASLFMEMTTFHGHSHPRSRKAVRSTPGGAYHPSGPYRAPSLNASSLFP